MRRLTHVDGESSVLSKEILKMLPSGKKCSLEEEIFSALIDRAEMHAWETQNLLMTWGALPASRL